MKHLLLVSSIFAFFSVSALAQPVITQNPQNAATCVDSCAYFSVSAVGNGLNYQWRMEDGAGGFTVVGTQQNLELCDSVLQFDGFSFYCAVFDSNGDSAISNMAALEVDSCLPPVADFYWDWSLAEICFTSTSLNAESVFWLFGDGTTNANSRDSDGDTMSDAQELALGLNPLAIEDFDDDDAGIGNGFDHHEVLFYDNNPKNSGEFPPLAGVQVDKLSAGYRIGSGLLGADMILDEALGGGNDYRFGTGNTNFSFVYQGLYNPGTNVTITGLAFILHKGNNETQPGDILFRFYELGADGEFDGIDCETEVGSALVSLEQSVIDGAANADAYHVSFTTPISFTTASTGFAIKIQSTGALRFKAQDNFLNASGLWVGDDGDPVGAGLRRVRLSIAGTPPTVDNTSIPTLTLEDFNSGQPILRVSAPGIPGGLDIYRSTSLGLGGWGSPVANGVADGATFTDVAAPAGKSFYIGVTNGDPAP